MAEYEVRDVAGVFKNGELKLVLNSRRIAENIVQLLEEDAGIDRGITIKGGSSFFEREKAKGNGCAV